METVFSADQDRDPVSGLFKPGNNARRLKKLRVQALMDDIAFEFENAAVWPTWGPATGSLSKKPAPCFARLLDHIGINAGVLMRPTESLVACGKDSSHGLLIPGAGHPFLN